MSIRERLSGNEAIACAMRQIDPDVFAAFPITPSTEIPQYFAQYVADGRVSTEFIPVESEHSSLSACIGAQAAGVRAVTATSSCGLAFMYEVLYVAASARLPITLACVNRTLTGPININNDHSDSMGARDTGWLQLYAENNQEAYDNYLQAMRIAETPDVRLPIMVCQDGFITSHAVEISCWRRTPPLRPSWASTARSTICSNRKIPWPWGPMIPAPTVWSIRYSRPKP